MGTFDPIFKG